MSAFDVPITPGCWSAVPRAPAMFGIPIPAGGPWLPEIARTPELLADTAETPAAFCDMAVTPAPACEVATTPKLFCETAPEALKDEPATPKVSVAVPHTPAGTERWSPLLRGLFGSVKRGPNGKPPVWPRTPYARRDAPHTPVALSDSPSTPLSVCDQPCTPGVSLEAPSTPS